MPTRKHDANHMSNTFIRCSLNKYCKLQMERLCLWTWTLIFCSEAEKNFSKSQLVTIFFLICFVVFFCGRVSSLFFVLGKALSPSRASSTQQQTTAVRLSFCLLSKLNWLSDTSQKQQTEHKGGHRNIHPLVGSCQLSVTPSSRGTACLQQKAASHSQQAGGWGSPMLSQA